MATENHNDEEISRDRNQEKINTISFDILDDLEFCYGPLYTKQSTEN
jgi:hypothetical protein